MSARICALYVGQMRVGCFAKTEPDSASFLRRGGSAVPAPAGPCSRAEPRQGCGRGACSSARAAGLGQSLAAERLMQAVHRGMTERRIRLALRFKILNVSALCV